MQVRARAVGAIFSFVCFVAIGALVFAASYLNESARIGTTSAVAETQPAAPEPVVTPQTAAALATAMAASAIIDVAATTQPVARVLRDGAPLQCAIYARQRTGISLSGAARTWWPQAEGRYRRSNRPQAGAVMAMLGTPSGHVAVVARVISDREILIDHANWLGGGEIILGAQVVDVSAANDWSRVRVWHPPTNSLGLSPYPVQRFILPEAI